MAHHTSGMAAAIRSSVDSETFDLAGQSAATIQSTIQDAFADPFTLPPGQMIRLTFVTGAGKLGRQKYDAGAAKSVCHELQQLGYSEDRGASAVVECAGSFKMQHDTGKNLKTVVVFPKIAQDQSLESATEGLQISSSVSLLEENSPEHKIAYSTLSTFERMLQSKCPTWSQKKGCLVAIDAILEQVQDLDNKLVQGQVLSEQEQDFYDSVSAKSLQDKQAYTKDQMHKHVEDGKLTAAERQLLLNQVSERLGALAKEIATAQSQSKPKLVQKLEQNQTKAQERKQKLSNMTPQPPPPLKHEQEINKLRNELAPLLEVEAAAKGRLLTLKESQAMARKDEILSEIEELEQDSRGWFESDEAFEARVEASRAKWRPPKKKTYAAVGQKASSSSAATKWSTPATRKKTTPKPKSSKPTTRGGGVFAAMMMDSDSD